MIGRNDLYIKKLKDVRRKELELELEYINKKIKLCNERYDIYEEELCKNGGSLYGIEYGVEQKTEEHIMLIQEHYCRTICEELYERKKEIEKILEEF